MAIVKKQIKCLNENHINRLSHEFIQITKKLHSNDLMIKQMNKKYIELKKQYFMTFFTVYGWPTWSHHPFTI